MTVVLVSNTKNYVGAAADSKPSGAPAGSTYLAADTGARFVYDGSTWQTVPGSGVAAVAVSQGDFTDRSGSITTGGTANSDIPANVARRCFMIQNLSTTVIWLNFGTTAVQDQPSIALKACTVAGDGSGGAMVFEGTFIPTGVISIIGPTTGAKFTAKEG